MREKTFVGATGIAGILCLGVGAWLGVRTGQSIALGVVWGAVGLAVGAIGEAKIMAINAVTGETARGRIALLIALVGGSVWAIYSSSSQDRPIAVWIVGGVLLGTAGARLVRRGRGNGGA